MKHLCLLLQLTLKHLHLVARVLVREAVNRGGRNGKKVTFLSASVPSRLIVRPGDMRGHLP